MDIIMQEEFRNKNDFDLIKSANLSIQSEAYKQFYIDALMSVVNKQSKTYQHVNLRPRCIYQFKVATQVLMINVSIVILIAIIFGIFYNVHFEIITDQIIQSSNKALELQNHNFQARTITKYMGLTQSLFQKTNQLLLATNQMYNYAITKQYQIELGFICSGKGYNYSDQFCYYSYNSSDIQSQQHTQYNKNFIKFISLLDQFSLCYESVHETKSSIQITLDGEDQMVATFPQHVVKPDYHPLQTYWYTYQKNQSSDPRLINYIPTYDMQDAFGSKNNTDRVIQSVSLTNGSIFQGVIIIDVEYEFLASYYSTYKHFSFGLIGLDGQLLFTQSEYSFNNYHAKLMYYDQASTGYHYQDWVDLTVRAKTTNNTYLLDNLYFIDSLLVTISQFKTLPYYFILFDNLVYQGLVRSIYKQLIFQIGQESNKQFIISSIVIGLTIIICQFVIFKLFIPINHIKQQIQGNQKSELSSLSFKKSAQCELFQNLQFPKQIKFKSHLRKMQSLVQEVHYPESFHTRNQNTMLLDAKFN